MIELLTVIDAARDLRVSADLVRLLERQGRLHAIRTRNGQRLFLSTDVQKLGAARAAAKAFDDSETEFA